MAAAQDAAGIRGVWAIPGFRSLMVAVACAFGAWSMLLPVVPLSVLESGGSATLAGTSTGVFMATTVATQVVTPRMVRTWGYRPVMAAAALVLGVPAFGHMLGDAALIVLTVSALRGIGFGALTVAENALIAEISPARLLGKASGALGIFVGASQMVCLPLGLALVETLGFRSVYAVAGCIGIVAFFMSLRIPALKAAAKHPHREGPARGGAGEASDSAAPPTAVGRPAVPMWKLVAVPAMALTSFSVSYGVLSNFISPAARELDPHLGAVLGGLILSFVGAAAMVSRYVSGVVADHRGRPDSLTLPSQVVGIAAVALIAITLWQGWSLWLVVLGAVAYGAGFGVVQTEALLSMFSRVPKEKVSEASAVWNIFFDGGTGAGSTALGVVVAASGYDAGFAVGAAIIAVGLGLTAVDRLLGRGRVVETNDIRTRLTRMLNKDA